MKIILCQSNPYNTYLVNFAQGYHRLEIKLKRKQADVSRPGIAITPLEDQKAVELAANFIGESIIFSVAVLAVVAEAYRKRLEDQTKQEQSSKARAELEARIDVLERQISQLLPPQKQQDIKEETKKT